jgi:signal transduction histidine kinase
MTNYKKKLFLYFVVIFSLFTVGVVLFEQMREREHFLKPDNFFLYYIAALFVIMLFFINYVADKSGKSIHKEIKLEQEKNRLQKQEMTGNITHELRTPVTGIRGCLETVLEHPLDKETERRFIVNAYNQVLALSELIHDMSLLTKIEGAAQSFQLESIVLGDLLENIKRDFALPLQEKKIRMHWNITKDVIIQGNRHLIYAIFRNLTDNVIRYAGSNLDILIRQYKTDKAFYYFSYADTGVGISATHHLNRLFERFYRVDEGRTRDTGGSGLGLSIVKNAIAFHNGSISVRNRKEGGLEFLFKLPSASADGQ